MISKNFCNGKWLIKSTIILNWFQRIFVMVNDSQNVKRFPRAYGKSPFQAN
jgi:hypothetical protein